MTMRISVLTLLAAFNTAVVAQLAQLPQCGQTCFSNNLGSCSSLDIACICGSSALINSIACCVYATCSQADIQSTLSFASSLCKSANVDINTSATCSASATALATSSSVASPIATISHDSITGSTFRSSPASLLPTSSSRSSESTRNPATTLSSAPPTNSTVDGVSRHSGVSKGAIVGIVLGVLAALALLGIALVFLLRRRKQRNTAHTNPAPEFGGNVHGTHKPELDATGAVSQKPRHELESLPSHFPEMWVPQHPANPHTELPSYAPGGQSHTYIAGGEMEAVPSHTQYVENTGPYYPEAYTVPASHNDAQTSRLDELEASQRGLEERMARMRQLHAMEEEHARMQAEIARLRNT